MSGDETPPRVAASHLCGGPSCYFCEWSNPPLDLPPGMVPLSVALNGALEEIEMAWLDRAEKEVKP